MQDIGVQVDDKLNFKEHIYTKIKKANAVMGIIQRTFHYRDQNMFPQHLKSLVRPLIDTSVAVWAPYKKTDSRITKGTNESHKASAWPETSGIFGTHKENKSANIGIWAP